MISVGGGLRSVEGDRLANREQLFEQCLHAVQRNHVGAVARRLVGVWVRLQEQPVDAYRDCGARECAGEFPLSARLSALSSGLLHRVRHIKDDGCRA